MVRAILFDFDGVLADSEPVHFELFCALLAQEGILLNWQTYQEKYLGLGDRDCFRAVYKDQNQTLSPLKESSFVQKKNHLLLEMIRKKSPLLPEAKSLLTTLSGRYYLGIVSGSLKGEIEAVLSDLTKFFHFIIGAEEVEKGKPDPEGYQLALKVLNRDFVPESEILLPAECVAVEDSPWGIEAAKQAGLTCFAMTTSYPAKDLPGADAYLSNLEELGDKLKGFP